MDHKKINELTQVAYNQMADKYHLQFKDEMEQKEYNRILLEEYSGMLPDQSLICNARCSPSDQIGNYLFHKGHKIIGIDNSKQCIEIAKEHNPLIQYKVMDMMQGERIYIIGTKN